MHKNLCRYLRDVEFEYDPDKSLRNSRKHGIDFEDAQKPWDDSNLVILPSRFADEERALAIGQVEDICRTAVFTERSGRMRLISVRRSRQEERTMYERNKEG
ncbi:MAG: BrnT family toxin [Spirochaetaceae bacterium]